MSEQTSLHSRSYKRHPGLNSAQTTLYFRHLKFMHPVLVPANQPLSSFSSLLLPPAVSLAELQPTQKLSSGNAASLEMRPDMGVGQKWNPGEWNPGEWNPGEWKQ